MINNFFSPMTITKNINFFQPSNKFLSGVLGQDHQHNMESLNPAFSSRHYIDGSSRHYIDGSSRHYIDGSILQ